LRNNFFVTYFGTQRLFKAGTKYSTVNVHGIEPWLAGAARTCAADDARATGASCSRERMIAKQARMEEEEEG